MDKYEIEPVCFGEDNHNVSLIGTVTGLEFDEITLSASKFKGGWTGSKYKKVLRDLGFNTSNGFVKFDPETPYPCIIRSAGHGCWYGFAYNNGMFYDSDGDAFNFKQHSRCWDGKYFVARREHLLKITSMLSVWI